MEYRRCKIEPVLRISSLYTAFEANYDEAFSFEGEAHDFWEMVCVLEGKIGVTADNEVHLLKAGQVIFHKPMVFHKIWAEMNTSPRIAIFSFQTIRMPEVPGTVYQLTYQNLDQLGQLLALSRRALMLEDIHVRGVKEGMEIEAQRLVDGLSLFILTVLSNETAENSISGTQSAQNYSRIVTVLEENVGKALAVPEIAAMCNMSESSLKKTFYKYSGKGVIHYFNTLKVNRAMALLREGRSVKETAFLLGFSDQNYFSTVFKRIAGQPPREYKE